MGSPVQPAAQPPQPPQPTQQPKTSYEQQILALRQNPAAGSTPLVDLLQRLGVDLTAGTSQRK